MAEWEEKSAELESLGCSVVAVSADSLEHAEKMQRESGAKFPIAYGVEREEAESLGAWWSEDRGGFVQPTEFLLGRGGTVLGAMYASGPVGRMSSDEALYAIRSRERRRRGG